MPNWKLVIEYEGTRYSGWQEQKNARTVAGEVRGAAERFFSMPVEVMGAGRTDAGVHALAQVASLRADRRVKPLELLRALNDGLPPDINVLRVDEAQPRFDPRRDAVMRYYMYQISLRRSAFAKRYVWWVKDRLDVSLMRDACGMLVGRHDFERFRDQRGDEGSSIVVVGHAEMVTDGELLLFRIGASHFLWKMVRRIVGALVDVGRASVSVRDFESLVKRGSSKERAGDYQIAAHTAPPSGLFLERVLYNKSEKVPPLSAAFPVKKA
ncbi:MAG TPA: tRNA pseudouridine(38-40) synthase TruA [Blastocatellia bacterium]